MKKLKTLMALLTLAMALGTTNSGSFIARADDPQGGTDTSRRPPCYPRCPIRPTAPLATASNNPASATTSTVQQAAPTETIGSTDAGFYEILTFTLLHLSQWL